MKDVLKKYLNRYFIDAMGAMALGLFASLLIGTIFGTLGKYVNGASIDNATLKSLAEVFNVIANYAKAATGMAIGVAIAYRLGAHPLVIFSSAAVGAMANAMGAVLSSESGALMQWAAISKPEGSTDIFYTAGPAGAFFAVIIACEIGQLVSKKTKVDILVTPVVTLVVGFAASWLLCPVVSYVMYYLGVFLAWATTFQPLLMGVVLSVVMGVVLTLPISSAAICAMIFSASAFEVAALNGTKEGLLLAGGACVAGCCAQMVGFAVVSFRENRWGGVISQGIGTSMLQMGNIVKKPVIWIAPTLAAAVTGPISTMVFKLKCQGVAAGMGTCGMVGPLGVIDAHLADGSADAKMWIGLALVCIVLPAILALVFNEIMRKLGWIKTGDMKLDV